jgi:hypothetical protein
MSPDFDELIGEGVAPAERERLRRAHEALLVAGPPPDLPVGLLRPRTAGHRTRPLFLLAAALAVAAAFAGGWLAGGAGGRDAEFTLGMRGTSAVPAASAELALYPVDRAGNWPMKMKIGGLPDGRYELVLTRGGKAVASCGFFRVHGRTETSLNAPYLLKTYDGWAVVRPGSSRILLRTPQI